ncbi:MAG: exodeoxyribonuclease VII large subunit [Acholeplasmataceae bacterium]|jgi:exodeoxyribonuclease VII large subunit
MDNQYLTVTALTKYIKYRLENDNHLQNILIKGEISNYTRSTRGHLYFSLKDETAQIKANMFYSSSKNLAFEPKDGDHVLIEAKINLYEPRGEYSLNVTKMTLDGIGELYLKYEQLKKTLEEQGYFDEKHKKPIPKFPKKIGVITSETGAVIQDIMNTINRRYRLTEVILYPTLVQGEDAKHDIARQIERANHENLVDVLIVGRGGGSIEDLWAFNEIEVINAIFNSKIPIISAIGHETDYTISDFVSSLRAPTPTAAAEMATPDEVVLKGYLVETINKLNREITNKLSNLEIKLAQLERRLELQSPQSKIEKNYEKLEILLNLLKKEIKIVLDNKQNELKLLQSKIITPIERVNSYQTKLNYLFKNLQSMMIDVYKNKVHQYQIHLTKLNSLNPLKILEKGFGVITKKEMLIKSINDVSIGDLIEIEIIDGKILTEVKEKRKKNGK